MDKYDELVRRLQERDLTRIGESRLELAKRRQLERDRAANAIKALQAEVERLREVLKIIAHFEPDRNSWSVKQARSALEAKP